MGESWDEVGQAVPAIEAVFEFGEVALCVLWPEGVIAAAQGRLQVVEHAIDPVELRFLQGGAPAPDDYRPVPASGPGHAVEAFQTVGNHLAAGARCRPAQSAMCDFRKPLTPLSLMRGGRPSSVVCTAATNGVLPSAPRPRLPPLRSPPRSASSRGTRPSRRWLPIRPVITGIRLFWMRQAAL